MSVVLAVAFLAAPLVCIAAWVIRRDRLRLTLMVASLSAWALWMGVIAIALTGWRDIDGAIDCWRYCDTTQQATRVVVVALPALAILSGLVAAVSLVRR